jgi:hypothetical protein
LDCSGAGSLPPPPPHAASASSIAQKVSRAFTGIAASITAGSHHTTHVASTLIQPASTFPSGVAMYRRECARPTNRAKLPRMFMPDRHEPLVSLDWSETAARAAIDAIVHAAHDEFARNGYWPLHPLDAEPGDDIEQPMFPFYFGAAGTIWALRYLQDAGAVARSNDYEAHLEAVLERNRQWLTAAGLGAESASYLMGDTPELLMMHGARPAPPLAARLAAVLAGNIEQPAREGMWGSPGPLRAASFL